MKQRYFWGPPACGWPEFEENDGRDLDDRPDEESGWDGQENHKEPRWDEQVPDDKDNSF